MGVSLAVARGCVALAAAGLALTLFPAGFWLLDDAAYWVPCYVAIALAGAAGCLWFRAWKWGGVGVAAVALAGALMVPSYLAPPNPAAAGQEANLRILQANVFEHGGDPEALMRLIRETSPDVVLLQESGDPWEASLRPLDSKYPYKSFVPRYPGGELGMGHLWRIVADAPRALCEEGLPATEMRLHVAGRSVRLLHAHTASPHSPRRARSHYKQMQDLTSYAAKVEGPLILAGDLNTSLWSKPYKRLIAAARLINARQGFGVLGTWPSFLGPLRTTLDNMLVSPEIRVVRTWVGPGIGSDHRPLITDLYVAPALAARPR